MGKTRGRRGRGHFGAAAELFDLFCFLERRHAGVAWGSNCQREQCGRSGAYGYPHRTKELSYGLRD